MRGKSGKRRREDKTRMREDEKMINDRDSLAVRIYSSSGVAS